MHYLNIVLPPRYQLSHILGLVMGVMSIVVIVWLDVRDGRGGVTGGGGDRLCGDLLSLLSATLTGVSQVLVCYVMQDFHPSEYLGMIGLWGVVITSGQIFLTEQQALLSLPWHTGPVQALLLSFFLAITTYYLCLPTAIKVGNLSSSFSLLSAFLTLAR